jgi:phosphoesterase RecJ-like protein
MTDLYFPEHAAVFKKVWKEHLQGNKVAVIGHRRPDGDCIGSQVALCLWLRQNGVDAVCVNEDKPTRVLEHLVTEEVPFYTDQDFNLDGHLAVTVDCADMSRIGDKLQSIFPTPLLNIDHHISNTLFAENNILAVSAIATGEILAGIFLDLRTTDGIEIGNPLVSHCCYVGIATDSGQFCYPADYPNVFKICSELYEAGARPVDAAKELYEKDTFSRLKLLQRFFDSLELEAEGKVCIGVVRQRDYEETGALREDLDGFVNYARAIEGVEIGGIIEDLGGKIKGSLRGKSQKWRVDKIAAKFNGGGHAAAAGFYLEMPFEEFKPLLLKEIAQNLANPDEGC